MEDKTVIVIVGPTAAGKTAAALELAKHFDTKIISADSRQCFKELNIGVARPSEAELQSIHHYFIASHSIHEEVNAALFEQLALQWTDEIFKDRAVAVMVGGTGLYIKAFCEGLDDMPPINLAIRTQIQDQYAQEGLSWLRHAVKANDPLFYASGEIQNPQRLMRALETKLATGRSILSYRSNQKKSRPFRIIKAGLDISKEQLHGNIDRRVDEMIEMGLVDEVKGLLHQRHRNALHTVGYTEIFDCLTGKISLDEATSAIKLHTRHYAKRQLTWFRKDTGIQWMNKGKLEMLKKI